MLKHRLISVGGKIGQKVGSFDKLRERFSGDNIRAKFLSIASTLGGDKGNEMASDLLHFQRAQSDFQKRKDEEERRQMLSAALAPFVQQYAKAQQKLDEKRSKPELGADRQMAWLTELKALETERDAAQLLCDPQKNPEVSRLYESLVRLDRWSDTAQLLLKSVHYGYLIFSTSVLIVCWIMYHFWKMIRLAIGWAPATSSQTKKIKLGVDELHAKVDSLVSKINEQVVPSPQREVAVAKLPMNEQVSVAPAVVVDANVTTETTAALPMAMTTAATTPAAPAATRPTLILVSSSVQTDDAAPAAQQQVLSAPLYFPALFPFSAEQQQQIMFLLQILMMLIQLFTLIRRR